MTREEFIAAVAPIAVHLRHKNSPIFPSVRIAQAMLETGCTLHPWNNLIGYKVGIGLPSDYWRGRNVSAKTWEVYDGMRVDGVQAHFRAYDSIEECFMDQDLLFAWSRYDRVRTARSPHLQAEMLQVCGYATDPDYSIKLVRLIDWHELMHYDQMEEEMMVFENDWQWKMLGDALDGLYRKGVVSDYTWAEKAYKRELTQSELAWLTTIAFARFNGIEI
ncbi:glycoside hydrolase family 73 protein [Paenibacillus sp. MBLB4367]|uniref:glycoside hydrolase family 73 protein n=1 Tax=Paenibacillus sp. MBLB4367 TaxID=3384767 RepID=UPI0039083731